MTDLLRNPTIPTTNLYSSLSWNPNRNSTTSCRRVAQTCARLHNQKNKKREEWSRVTRHRPHRFPERETEHDRFPLSQANYSNFSTSEPHSQGVKTHSQVLHSGFTHIHTLISTLPTQRTLETWELTHEKKILITFLRLLAASGRLSTGLVGIRRPGSGGSSLFGISSSDVLQPLLQLLLPLGYLLLVLRPTAPFLV